VGVTVAVAAKSGLPILLARITKNRVLLVLKAKFDADDEQSRAGKRRLR
jgi:hypothetical protein